MNSLKKGFSFTTIVDNCLTYFSVFCTVFYVFECHMTGPRVEFYENRSEVKNERMIYS